MKDSKFISEYNKVMEKIDESKFKDIEKAVFYLDENNKYHELAVPMRGYNCRNRYCKGYNVYMLHNILYDMNNNFNLVEISTYSYDDFGKNLSAHNLMHDGYCVECIYQSSKVFSNGRQAGNLLEVDPKVVKDELSKWRIRNKVKAGDIIGFRYKGEEYANEPKHAFYDYFYILGLLENNYIEKLINYNAFTDIGFEYRNTVNCQARSCAIALYLYKNNLVDKYMKDYDSFIKIYKDLNIK